MWMHGRKSSLCYLNDKKRFSVGDYSFCIQYFNCNTMFWNKTAFLFLSANDRPKCVLIAFLFWTTIIWLEWSMVLRFYAVLLIKILWVVSLLPMCLMFLFVAMLVMVARTWFVERFLIFLQILQIFKISACSYLTH